MKPAMLAWADFEALLPPPIADEAIEAMWQQAVRQLPPKILVLDDDPTGVQTVHDVPVYTRHDAETLSAALQDESRVVFLLTNSRALTASQTRSLHRQIGRDLKQAAREHNVRFLLISRGDSTLRGHFPLETQVLNAELGGFDGEILIPFFGAGGRLTWRDTHWVRDGARLTPVGETEFARDAVFGFQSSDLKDWIEEKTGGEFPAREVTSITLETLRAGDFEAIEAQLNKVRNCGKVIVNAVEDNDLKVFVVALARAMAGGKTFLFRTAASWVPIIAGMRPKPLLTRDEMAGDAATPGLVVVGSHTAKTTRQLHELRQSALDAVELDVSQAHGADWPDEVERAAKGVNAALRAGRDVCLATSREFVAAAALGDDEAFAFSKRVSDALVSIVEALQIRPGFLIAKGGITSSDLGVKALQVKRAIVRGQVAPGVPVWQLGAESRFPGLSYVIFPGNVGEDDTLKRVFETLRRSAGNQDSEEEHST